MSTQNNMWQINKNGLSYYIVSSLKKLDAADKRKGEQLHDGEFKGKDLVKFAQEASSYISGISDLRIKVMTETAICRLIHATHGLHKYGSKLSQHGRDSTLVLESAMYEGMLALVEGREADYLKIAGFRGRFIPQEFSAYFIDILSGSTYSCNGWKNYWQHILNGCWPDMFINSNNCEFPPRD